MPVTCATAKNLSGALPSRDMKKWGPESGRRFDVDQAELLAFEIVQRLIGASAFT